MKRQKIVVLDLEFLAHEPKAVVTGLGMAWGDPVMDPELNYLGYRTSVDDRRNMISKGFKVHPPTEGWARDNHMDEILSALEEKEIKRILQEMVDKMKGFDYIFERSVGADIPKFLSLCEAYEVAFEIPYWSIMEVRSYLAGAGTTFLNLVWDEAYTKHNPVHDALMDYRRLQYAARFKELERGHQQKIQFVMAGGGSIGLLEDMLIEDPTEE